MSNSRARKTTLLAALAATAAVCVLWSQNASAAGPVAPLVVPHVVPHTVPPVARPVAPPVVPPASPPVAPPVVPPTTGYALVTHTFDVDPRPAVYDAADGYSAGPSAGQKIVFSVPAGDVVVSLGTKVRLSWTGTTADPPDAMGVDIAAQAVQVRDVRPVRLDRWAFEVVNPYVDCRSIPNRMTTVDCTGWKVHVVVTAVVVHLS